MPTLLLHKECLHYYDMPSWSADFIIGTCSHRCNPSTAGRGRFEIHRFPQQRNDPTPRLGVTSAKNANQRDPRASADAESARNDLPRAPCPQDILKVRPPNSLDYRARYDTPALIKDQPLEYYKIKIHRGLGYHSVPCNPSYWEAGL